MSTDKPFSHRFDHLPSMEGSGRTPVLMTEAEYKHAARCWNICEGVPAHSVAALSMVGGLAMLAARVTELKAESSVSAIIMAEALRLINAIEAGAQPKEDPEALARLKAALTGAIQRHYEDDQQQAQLAIKRHAEIPYLCPACHGHGGHAKWTECRPCSGSGLVIPF